LLLSLWDCQRESNDIPERPTLIEEGERKLLHSQLLEVGGKLEHATGVTHVSSEELVDRTA
jgi:hypothetical protein